MRHGEAARKIECDRASKAAELETILARQDDVAEKVEVAAKT